MSIESVMPSNHLILCCPLLLLPSIFSSIRVFSNESALCVRRPKYWSFSFSVSPSSEYSGLISFRIDSPRSLQSKGLSRVFSNSCPLSQWCHPTISSSVVPFSSCLLSFPASGSFSMSCLFVSGHQNNQNIGASASASVLPMNEHHNPVASSKVNIHYSWNALLIT